MKLQIMLRRMAAFIFISTMAFSVGVVYGQVEILSEESVAPSLEAEVGEVFGTSIEEETGTSTLETTPLEAGIIEALTAPKQDLTKPELEVEKNEIQKLLEKRLVQKPGILNFFAYWVQKAIALGIPANTIVLIFLVPVIATLIAFVRVVIGLPALEMLVPIVLSFAFVAVGITAGLIILGAVVLATFASRTMLRKVPIMYFPKRSLSHFFLAIFVFAALTLAIILDIESIRNLSIFPVLILTLLGDSIVSVQLRKTVRETVLITSVTLGLALIGYVLATSVMVRDVIILWPEVILLTIPVNFLLGRYFGLRLSEVFRFKTLESYASE
jgi:7 transmembrane helices usually fused to an inactive transglutaminase